MKISKILLNNDKPPHKELDFVNTSLIGDTKLFIDPVLIEIGNSNFCKRANKVIKDYFSFFYEIYYNNKGENEKRYLLKYAQEINSTHLGYASKNGKGNTESGLLEIFNGIDKYVNSIKMSSPLDIVLCVPNFSMDGMSDLLTNILYKELSDFTIKQCESNNYPLENANEKHYYWDLDSHCWKLYEGKSMIVDGNTFLLVPKEIVQTHYRFTCDNYLRSVIVESLCEKRAIISRDGHKDRPPKGKVREELLKQNGTIFKTIINYTKSENDFLNQYHNVVFKKYKTFKMEDDELDKIIYGKSNLN